MPHPFKFCFHHNTSPIVSKRKQRKARMTAWTPLYVSHEALFILQVNC